MEFTSPSCEQTSHLSTPTEVVPPESCDLANRRTAIRRGQILEIISETDEVRVTRLAEKLQVSEMTVRHDLKAFEAAGVLKRVYGGAATTRSPALPPMTRRETRRSADKTAIAKSAARLVEPSSNVLIGASSTTAYLAQELAYGPVASSIRSWSRNASSKAFKGMSVCLAGLCGPTPRS